MAGLIGEGFPKKFGEEKETASHEGFSFRNIEGFPTGPTGVTDTFGPEMGWEFTRAAEHPLLYPIERTIADIVPFMSFAFPSGRKEFKEAGIGGKAFTLALDAAVVIPVSWIGTGLKALASPITKPLGGLLRAGATKTGLRMLKIEEASPGTLDRLLRKMDEFIYETPENNLMRSYKLTSEEADAVLKGTGEVWMRHPRSGGFSFGRTSATEALYNAEGKLDGKVAAKISKWKEPPEVQRLKHYKKEYNRYFSRYLEGTEYKLKRLFDSQVGALFGSEQMGKMTLSNIAAVDFDKILLDGLLNEGKLLRRLDATSWSYLLPVRRIAGKWDGLYRTGSLKKRITKTMGMANDLSLRYVKKFHLIQIDRGLGTLDKLGRFDAKYSRAQFRRAGELIKEIDNAQGAGRATKPILQAEPDLTVQKLVMSYHEWTDFVYADYLKYKIPEVFEKAGLTPKGRDAMWSLLNPRGKGIFSYITEAFAAGNAVDHNVKVKFLGNLLETLKSQATKNTATWFKEPSEDVLKTLARELSFREPGAAKGIPHYLENYGARLFDPLDRGRYAKKIVQAPGKNQTPGFIKGRYAEEAPEAIEDLAERVTARSRQQGRWLLFNPARDSIVSDINKLPPRLKELYGHYVSRLTGATSPTDAKVAAWVNRKLGTNWNAARVSDLAYKINDFIYLGGLGFKPFSAMRNLFQPILNVPADMGGIKDVYWLTKGLPRGYSPATREWIREAGIITEYSPDLLFRPQVSKFARRARFEQFRDLGMWMFRHSDQHNRYWTAGAALEKWEYFFKKFSKQTSGGHSILDLNKFEAKLNLNSRQPWVRNEIDDLLRQGTGVSYDEAKKVWVKDVVADTQYLYGPFEAPLIGQKYGSLSRTAVVFQSWWMNYAALLEKWFTQTGSVEATAARLLPWMMASAVGYHVMSEYWGKQTAARSVFLGPLPTQVDIPAPWRPFVDALNTVVVAAGVPIGVSDIDQARSRMISTLKSASVFVPAGLQITKTLPMTIDEGFEGFAKSLLNIRD